MLSGSESFVRTVGIARKFGPESLAPHPRVVNVGSLVQREVPGGGGARTVAPFLTFCERAAGAARIKVRIAVVRLLCELPIIGAIKRTFLRFAWLKLELKIELHASGRLCGDRSAEEG